MASSSVSSSNMTSAAMAGPSFGAISVPFPLSSTLASSSNSVDAGKEWHLVETLRLLELFVGDNASMRAARLWEDRARALEREFGAKRPLGFFTARSVKDELNRVFLCPNPEHVTLGLPAHARSKEAAEMWIVHYRKEVEREKETQRHTFWISARHMLDILQRYKRDEISSEELKAIRDEMRERDARRPDAMEQEERIQKIMDETSIEDVRKIDSLQDLVNIVMSDRGLLDDDARAAPILLPKGVSRSPEKGIRSPVIGSPLPAIRQQPPPLAPATITAPPMSPTTVAGKEPTPVPIVTPSMLVKASTPPPTAAVQCQMLSAGLEAEDFESPEQVIGAQPPAVVEDKTPPTVHDEGQGVEDVIARKPSRGRARRVVVVEQQAEPPTPAVGRKRRRQEASPAETEEQPSTSTSIDHPAPKRSKRLSKEEPTEPVKPLGIVIPAVSTRLPAATGMEGGGAIKKPSPIGAASVVKIITPRRLSSQHSPPTLSVSSQLIQTLTAAGGEGNDGGEQSPTAKSPTKRGRGRKRESVGEEERVNVVGQEVEEQVVPRPKPVEMLKVGEEATMVEPKDWDKEEGEIDEELERALWWRERSGIVGRLSVGTQTNISIQHETATTESPLSVVKGRSRATTRGVGRPKRQKSPGEKEFTTSAVQTTRLEFADDDVIVMQSIGRNKVHQFQAGWVPRAPNKATMAEIDAENKAAALIALKAEESSTGPSKPTQVVKLASRSQLRAAGRSRRTRESSSASSEVNSSVATEEREQDEPDQFVKVVYLPKLRLSSTSALKTADIPPTERVGRRGVISSRHRSDETLTGNYSSWEAVPKQLLIGVWKEIAGHKHANVFMHAVSDEAVPSYYTTVRRPMTLILIKRMIDAGAIRTFGKMTDAIAQMCSNAVMFNPESHDVNHYAKVLLQHALKSIRDVQRPAEHTGSRHTAGIATAHFLAGTQRGSRRSIASAGHSGGLGKLEVQIHPPSVGGSSQRSDSIPTDSITTPSIKADSPSPHVFTPPVAPAGRRKRKMVGEEEPVGEAVKAKRGRRNSKLGEKSDDESEDAPQMLSRSASHRFATNTAGPSRASASASTRREDPMSSGRSALRRVESVMDRPSTSGRGGARGSRRGGISEERASKARRSD